MTGYPRIRLVRGARSRSARRTRGASSRTLLGALIVALASATAACDSGGGGDAVDWLRQPLQVGWVASDPPRVLYTVAVDSREDHDTVLQVVDAGSKITFNQAAADDENGNAPLVPGTELTRAYWLWDPTGLVVGTRTHVLVVAEDSAGERQLRRVTWEGEAGETTTGVVNGSNGVIAYAALPCDADVCVVLARATAATGPTDLTLARFDEAGDRVGDPTTIQRLDGLVRSIHAAPVPSDGTTPAAAVDVLAVTCEGCDALTYDTYEEDLYSVKSRVVHLRVPLDGTEAALPDALDEWGGLVEPATSAVTAAGLTLLYWRTASEDAPGCDSHGHCAIARDLVSATWTRETGAFAKGTTIATSELAYLQAAVLSDGRAWALWRETSEDDVWLRTLRFAEIADGAPTTTIARTFAPLLLRDALSKSPATLPFEYVDGLAAVGTADDGPWVALRFRSLLPGGPEVCGEAARVGVWTAQLSTDGLVATSNTDAETLRSETVCGDATCAAAGADARGAAAPLAPLFALLFALFVALRRSRAPR